MPRISSCNKNWIQSWKDRLHFVNLPTYDLGNWIPYASMHWPCFGSGCALAQVVINSKEGNAVLYTCIYMSYLIFEKVANETLSMHFL